MAKSKKNKTTTKVEHVLQYAIRDFDFLQLMLKDLDKALKVKNMNLTKNDRENLQKMLDFKSKVSGEDIVRIVNYIINGRLDELIIRGVWGIREKPKIRK